LKAVTAGKDINYEGVSGPVDLNSRGDPTTGLYDLFQFKNGKLVTLRQIDTK